MLHPGVSNHSLSACVICEVLVLTEEMRQRLEDDRAG